MPTTSAPPTKEHLLDVAERLFAEHGFDGASLRRITAEAGANLASVNYHFGSKDGLIAELVARSFGPINQERIRLLDAIEREAHPAAPSIEAICDAFIHPLMDPSGRPPEKQVFLKKLLARCMSDPPETVQQVIYKHYDTVTQRFRDAIHSACPHLTPEEVLWRMHFAAGAVFRAMSHGDFLARISKGTCDPDDLDGAILRLRSFLSGGFQAGIPADDRRNSGLDG